MAIVQAFDKHRIAIWLTLSLIAFVTLVWFGYQATSAGVQQAENSYEARRAVFFVLTDLLDQETGIRGYTSTRKRLYLAPYIRGRDAFYSDVRRADDAAVAADANRVRGALLSIEGTYRRWFRVIAQPLLANPARDDASNLQAQGKELMDRMRLYDAHALDDIDAKTIMYADNTRDRLAFGGMLSVLLGLAMYWVSLALLMVQHRLAAERDSHTVTAQDLILVVRMNGYFTSVNPAAERTLGWSREVLLSRPFISFVHPDDVDRTLQVMKGLADGRSVEGFRIRYRAADQTYRWLVWNAVPDVGKGIIYASARDETQRVLSEDAHELMAYTDDLTGLPNRAAFMTHAARSLSIARRLQSDIAVILFDLNDFKLVNDKHGHAVGDELLRQVAARVRSSLRDSDFVARLGGDEFTVLLQAQTGKLDLHTVIRKIHASFRETYSISGNEIGISASIGASSFPADGDSTEELLARADREMYARKREAAVTG